jgi:hypothetical protein
MVIPESGLCGGLLSPVCDLVGSAGSSAADLVLGSIGSAFVSAAKSVSTIALDALDATTRIDLTASWFTKNVGVIAAVTLPAVVALFTLQVIGSVLRREPGGLGRAVLGVGKAMLGSALAIAITQLALLATDQICAVIAASAGTSVKGAALRFLKLTWLAGPVAGPVLQMMLGAAIIIGSLLLWAVLLFRKAAVLLVAVFAPVAFAGAVWDQTRGWSRRWIEAMAALVLCKVVIVVVFVLGLSAFGTDGTTQTAGGPGSQPAGTSLSDLLVGLMLLSIAVFAPWTTWKFVHWSGMEAGTALHSSMAASPVPNAVRSTASQARFMAQSAATSALLGGAGGAVGGGAAAKTSGAGAGGAARAAGGAAPPTPPMNGSAGSGRGAAPTALLDPPRPGSTGGGTR